jgi:23S rRNA (uridine2552-2'-O)-methyltransferase
VFKLAEIDEREQLFRRGMTCVDLGAAPGGWSQYAVRRVGRTGKVWAVDLLPIDPIEGVEILEGDLTQPDVVGELCSALPKGVDLVMSDMAPNLSGTRAIDVPRHMALAEEALAFAEQALKPGGDLLLKLFQGEGVDEFVARVRSRFAKARLIKPKASRAESSEIYLLARQHGM